VHVPAPRSALDLPPPRSSNTSTVGSPSGTRPARRGGRGDGHRSCFKSLTSDGLLVERLSPSAVTLTLTRSQVSAEPPPGRREQPAVRDRGRKSNGQFGADLDHRPVRRRRHRCWDQRPEWPRASCTGLPRPGPGDARGPGDPLTTLKCTLWHRGRNSGSSPPRPTGKPPIRTDVGGSRPCRQSGAPGATQPRSYSGLPERLGARSVEDLHAPSGSCLREPSPCYAGTCVFRRRAHQVTTQDQRARSQRAGPHR